MLRILALAATSTCAASLCWAQNLDVIKQRRQAMQAVAAVNVANFKMLKGDAPFDLAAVRSGLATLQERGTVFKTQFPDDSKEGGGTDALPKIWTARSEFNAVADKWIADAKTLSTAVVDEASFKGLYPAFANACGGCHNEKGGFTVGLRESFKKLKP